VATCGEGADVIVWRLPEEAGLEVSPRPGPVALVEDEEGPGRLVRAGGGEVKLPPRHALEIGPDGRQALVIAEDGWWDLWDLIEGRIIRSTRSPVEPDEWRIAPCLARVAARDREAARVDVFDVPTGERVPLPAECEKAWDAHFSEDAALLAVDSFDTLVVDLAKKKVVSRLRRCPLPMPDHRSGYRKMAFDAGKTRLACLRIEGELELWDIASGVRIAGWTGPRFADRLWFDSNGRIQVFAGNLLWTIDPDRSPVRVRTLPAGAEYIHAIEVNAKGDLAITNGYDGRVKVWDLAKRSVLREFGSDDRPIWAAKLLPEDRIVVSGRVSPTRVLNVRTGGLVAELEPDGDFRSFAVRKNLLAAGGGGRVTIWSTAAWKREFERRDLDERIGSLIFCDEGAMLLTASGSG
jgi:WD40 repeat protein